MFEFIVFNKPTNQLKYMKYLRIIGVVFLAILLSACNNQSVFSDKVTLQWVSDTTLQTPESVVYYPQNEVLFVSNINGHPTASDGNGFISVLDLSGNIKHLKWVEGLNAPKGMDIYNGVLYVSDINKVVAIQIDSARIIKTHEIESAEFLNDIAISDSGVIYISDMTANCLYQLRDTSIKRVLCGSEIPYINGLTFINDELYAGVNPKILKINTSDFSVTQVAKVNYGIDGIKQLDKDRFIISDWAGHVQIVQNNQKTELLFDTTPDEINAADIEYISVKNLLLVPTFYSNTVSAYMVQP